MKSWPTLMKIFLELLKDSFNDWNFFFFWDIMWHLEPHSKKKMLFFFFFSKFPQILEFQMWIFGRNFGRSAENSIRNILLPQILTKKILSKINPLHHLKIQKVVPPPRNGHFWGGVRKLYVTYPNKVLNCKACFEIWVF